METIDISVIRLKRTVHLLAEINASGGDVWKHGLESGNLLLRLVAAIVDQDINLRDLLPKRPPKQRVRLVADEDSGSVLFVDTASGFDVDTIDVTSVTEVFVPHRQASTTVDSNLHEVDFPADKPPKVALVDVEVMAPFP